MNMTNNTTFDKAVCFIEKTKKLIRSENIPREFKEIISDQLGLFSDYVNILWENAWKVEIIRTSGASPKEVGEELTKLDRARRNSHDSVIGAINLINRIATKFGEPQVTDIDTSDRYLVADFTGDAVMYVYKAEIAASRQGTGIAGAISVADENQHGFDSIADKL